MTYKESVLRTKLYFANRFLKESERQRDLYRMSFLLLTVCLSAMCIVTFLISLL